MKPRVVALWAANAMVLALGAAGLSACVQRQSPAVTQVQISSANNAFFQEQMVLARQALERQEWLAARQNLDGVVEALPPTDPLGAEARAGLARIAFELGDYARAAQVAGEVPAGTPFTADALESRGLAQLFSCDFDSATATFYQLAQVDDARGRVWIGVANAWTGADANAERELTQVVSTHAGSDQAPNARFYLAQLAMWGRRAGPAQRALTALNQSSPQYLGQLDTRAQNWLSRRTHLMRAFFSFDTMARLGRMTRSPDAAAQDQRADQALQMLQQNPGACAPQVQRLLQARTATAAERDAWLQANRDADGDGVPDSSDRCPNEAETRNGTADDDGCPESTASISLEGNQIRILAGFGIVFGSGDESVLDPSRPVIDQLAALLQSPQYAWIRRIRLEGHTDDVGDESANLDLSSRRVRRVGAMLASRGVSVDRIAFAHYGETRPIDPTGTEDARARNRRVEIFVIDPPMFGGVRAPQ